MEGLRVAGLSCWYRSPQSMVVRNIYFEARSGEKLFVLGRVASGKTTLLRGVVGLAPCKGSVMLDDRDLSVEPPERRARLLAYLPQVVAPTGLTVYEAVATGRAQHAKIRLTPMDRELIKNVLEALGLWELRNARLTELSGGQLRKTLIAAMLVREPRVLLLDEPTAGLDIASALELINILRDIANKGRVIVVATHDLSLALNYADKVLVLKNGVPIAYGSPRRALTPETIISAYGVRASIVNTGRAKTVVVEEPLRGNQLL